MPHRIGFVVGAVTLSLAVVASPALAAPGSGTTFPEGAESAADIAEGDASTRVYSSATLAPQPPPQSRPLIAVAHRGASGYAPENTLAAIDEAHRLGAETVEVDVQLTADDELVLIHDTTLARTTDVAEVFPGRAPYNVGDFTLAEIRGLDAGSFFGEEFAGEPVPLLREALDRLEGFDMNLLLEVKQPALYPGIERQIAAELAGHPHWLAPNPPHRPHRLVVQSFDWDSAELSKGLLPSVPHALLGRVPQERIAEFDWAHMINPNHTTIDADYVSAVQDAGLEIMPYTVNEPAAMRRTLGLGVDGFITDFPDVGQRVIEEFLDGREQDAAQAADEVRRVEGPGAGGEGLARKTEGAEEAAELVSN